jgi:hypothetical protein
MNHPIKQLGGEGILNKDDLLDFSKAEQAILRWMQGGEWRSASSIIEQSGQREGLRRLRNLRSKGLVIERKRVSKEREFYYRMLTPTTPENEQLELL